MERTKVNMTPLCDLHYVPMSNVIVATTNNGLMDAYHRSGACIKDWFTLGGHF